MSADRADAWSEDELAVLYDFVNDEDWLDEACALLPRRNPGAIKVKMCKLRREAEIVPRHYTGNSRAMSARNANRAAAAEGSRKLALALLALDVDSSPARLVEDESTAPALSEHDRREADTLRVVEAEHLQFPVEPGHEIQLEFFVGPLFEWRQAA